MPVHVKAVPGKPYGTEPRVCLRIESGYRAGRNIEHSGGGESPMQWPNRAAAEKWAGEVGHTVLPADPAADPASIKLLVNLFETFSDFQFEHRDVNGADLVDDLGRWLREHKAEVAGMAPIKADPAALKLKDLLRMCRALHSGDTEVNGGDLVDIFGEWLAETAAVMPEIVGGPFEAKVARSGDDQAYWSERSGWGELEDATAYFMTVPRGLTCDVTAEWVEVNLASEELAQAERWVAMETQRG